MNKKNYICVILFIGCLLLNGCGEQSDKLSEEEEALVNEIVNETLRDIDTKENEIYVLLSNKHSISEETIRLLINEYTKQYKTNSNAKTILDKLCTTHNLTKEKLASIIFDYRLFTKDTMLEE